MVTGQILVLLRVGRGDLRNDRTCAVLWIKGRERESSNVYFRRVIKVLPWSFAVKETYLMLRIYVDYRRRFSFLPVVSERIKMKKSEGRTVATPVPLGPRDARKWGRYRPAPVSWTALSGVPKAM